LIRYDGRTVEARLMDQTRDELLAHLGRRPSVTQKALIERAVLLALKIAQLDQRLVAGVMTEYDNKAYLAWVNTYRRLLGQLGLDADAPAAPDPMAALRAHLQRTEAA
jgi:hypothetical protein